MEAPSAKTASATVSVKVAAEVLGIGPSTAWRLIAQGRFPVPVLIVGGQRRISREALEQFINPAKVEAAS